MVLGVFFVAKNRIKRGRIKLFILTDGKNYVMENPFRQGDYLSTTSPVQAKEFPHKQQARALLQRKGNKYLWLKGFQIVDIDTGKKLKQSNYKGNGGVYIGKNDIDFDDSILKKIISESKSILGLAGWDNQQLETYKNTLQVAQSKFDSAESDILHTLQKYREDNNGKKPQAHKMAKIGYLLDDVRNKRKDVKQCLNYIKVMQDAIRYKYDIGKIKLELSKARYSEYKGRTKYYEMALDILK